MWIKPKKVNKNKKKKRKKRKYKGRKIDKNENTYKWINENKFDIFGVGETGVNWKMVHKHRHIKQHFNRIHRQTKSKVITATNKYNSQKVYGEGLH